MVLKVMKFFRGYLFVRLTGILRNVFLIYVEMRILFYGRSSRQKMVILFCQSAGFSEVETDVAKKRNQSYDFETCRCSVFTVSIPPSSLFLCWVRQSVCNSVFDDTVCLGGRNIRKQQLFRTGITRFSGRIRYRLRKLETQY